MLLITPKNTPITRILPSCCCVLAKPWDLREEPPSRGCLIEDHDDSLSLGALPHASMLHSRPVFSAVETAFYQQPEPQPLSSPCRCCCCCCVGDCQQGRCTHSTSSLQAMRGRSHLPHRLHRCCCQCGYLEHPMTACASLVLGHSGCRDYPDVGTLPFLAIRVAVAEARGCCPC